MTVVHNEMSTQIDFKSFKLQIDNEIYRFKKENPQISFKELTELINIEFNTSFTVNDLINRWENMQNVGKETTLAIFHEFQKYETDFVAISEKLGIALYRVKKEIVTGLVTNIWKVCCIVRKRSISSLKSNFISSKSIKSLIYMILKSSNFKNVKEQYSMLWNFISRFYEETHFKSVSDENYKLIYRELIILAEKYKINDMVDEGADVGFERKILEQNGGRGRENAIFALLNDFKKKNPQQTIDLISEEEEQQNFQPQAVESPPMPIEQQSEPYEMTIFQKLVNLYHRMSELQSMMKDNCNSNVREEMARLAVTICYFEEVLRMP